MPAEPPSSPQSEEPQTRGTNPGGTSGAAVRAPWWIGYLVTLILEAALTAGLLALTPHYPLSRFPIPYVLLIMFVAYIFGEGPAVLAFIVGLVAFDYYFVPPLGTLIPHIETAEGSAALAAFMLGTAIVGYATILMRRSRERLRQIAETLRESRERLQALFDNVADAILITDLGGRLLHANRVACETMAYSIEECLGKSLHDFSAEEEKGLVSLQLAEVIERGNATFETVYVSRGGDPISVEVNAQLIEYDGRPAVLAVARDITERKEAEQRERDLENHKIDFYHRTLQAATGGKLVISDRPGIEWMAGPALATWEISDSHDLSPVRNDAAERAMAAGMDESRIGKFQVCVGEAATNAIKHAGKAVASLHKTADSIIVIVSDDGPGIEAVTLPDVALTPGYSTAGTLGMGYKVMLSFADKLYLATGPEGTTLAIEMKLQEDELPTLPTGLEFSAMRR